MTTASRVWQVATAIGCAALVASVPVRRAEACGCFVPPDPTVPVVQAGERILFAMEGGEVVAHIQIQYAGNDGEFGWILPLPSVPDVKVGTDELFTQLINSTQPKYALDRIYEGNCPFDPSRTLARSGAVADGAENAAPPAAPGGAGGYTPLVVQDSVGPYDYAVLKADRKQEMLDWLDENRYFVPAGTDEAVDPYIRPGAYFLALKLRSGNSTGDLQPVVLRYKSDLPMIPIVLTSVAAQPDMGVQVWMLGEGRAIPRNYYHTVLNDAQLDWIGGAQNYNDVIIAATKEAPERHTFVTEYAGSSERMRKVLNYDGRFGSTDELARQPDEIAFVEYLTYNGYLFTSQLTSILGRYIPLPAGFTDWYVSWYGGVEANAAANFYGQLRYYLSEDFRQQNPEVFEEGYTINYQPQEMAEEIDERIVQPTLEAGRIFDRYPYLTRLYTTLSPEDMTDDPVFSFNRELPDVNNEHRGKLTYHCGFSGASDQGTTPATLVTESGWVLYFPQGTGEPGFFAGPRPAEDFVPPSGPFSQRIEKLSEEGAPEVIRDNTPEIERMQPDGGCAVAGPAGERSSRGAGLVLLLALAGLLMRARRR